MNTPAQFDRFMRDTSVWQCTSETHHAQCRALRATVMRMAPEPVSIRLPSIDAVHAFEAAARLGSFPRVAQTGWREVP
jgi:carboxylesterase type B